MANPKKQTEFLSRVALIVILSGWIGVSIHWAEAEGKTSKLPSFKSMERVTRNIQQPIVDATLNLQSGFREQVEAALKAIQDEEARKKGQVVQTAVPELVRMTNALVDGPFGKRFFPRVQARAARLSAGQSVGFTSTNGDTITTSALTGFPDPSSFSIPQLDRFNQLLTGLTGSLQQSLNTATGELSVENLNSVLGLAGQNGTNLTSAQNLLNDIVGVQIPNTQTLLGEAQSLLSETQGLLSGAQGTYDSITGTVSSLQSAMSNLNPADFADSDAFNQAYNALNSSLGDALNQASIVGNTISALTAQVSSITQNISGLTSTLNGLIDQKNLLNLVDIPFFETAGEIFSIFTQGISLSTLSSSVSNIMSQLLPFDLMDLSIPAMIMQFASLNGILSLLGGNFGDISGSMQSIISQLQGGSIFSVMDQYITTPFDIAGTLLPAAQSGNIAGLISAAMSLFGSSIQGALGSIGLYQALPLSTSQSGPQTARMFAPSTSTVPAIPFGMPGRKATRQNFCSGIKGAGKVQRCVEREERNWKLFQAKLRSAVKKGVTQLSSPAVVEKIERKAFGQPLKTILAAKIAEARAVAVP